jgi:RNA polymerase sigma-70 factor (ECF subfamily)
MGITQEQLNRDRLTVLAVKAGNGDMDAMTAILIEEQSKVMKTIYKYDVPEIDAKDLCQEILLHLFLKIKQYRKESFFVQWFRQLSYHKIVAYHKRVSRRNYVVQQYIANRCISMDKVTVQHNDLVAEELLSCLSDKCRDTIVRHVINGSTFVEMESSSGISRNTYRTRQRIGFENLRQAILMN